MKLLQFFALGCSFLCVFCLFGCQKTMSTATILRDDARVGGSLSFVFDKNLHTAYVGGDGEFVQFSQSNAEKGFDAGYRVGLKVVAPSEKINFDNSKLEINGVKYVLGSFLETINEEKQGFFNLYPEFSKEDREVNFSIKWDDGIKKQEYKIILAEGTGFAGKSS